MYFIKGGGGGGLSYIRVHIEGLLELQGGGRDLVKGGRADILLMLL